MKDVLKIVDRLVAKDPQRAIKTIIVADIKAAS
jgi:hypothetical protein